MKTLRHYLNDRLELGRIGVVKTRDGVRTYLDGCAKRYIPDGELIGVYESITDKAKVVEQIIEDIDA